MEISEITSPTVFEIADSVAVLHLDDGKANAMGYEALAALEAAVDAAESEARALVIAGRPGCFCAGFDLRVVSSGPDAARDLITAGARLAMRIYGARVPVVAACTGHALAFGAIMLLAADSRIGADGDAKIGFNEVAIGLPLPHFLVELARDRLDARQFNRATALASVYSPRGALDAGYLDELAPAEELHAIALAHASELAKRLNATAFALTRRNTRQPTIDRVMANLEADLADFAVYR